MTRHEEGPALSERPAPQQDLIPTKSHDIDTVAPATDVSRHIDCVVSEDEARWITSDLRNQLDCLQWTIHQIVKLVAKARDGSAHVALGYRSWTEYVAEEFGQAKAGGPKTRLARDDRKVLVQRLNDMGMSTRAIGTLVGTSHMTVTRDLESSAVTNVPADAEPTEAIGSPADVAIPLTIPPLMTTTSNVVGIDGKTYVRPARKPSRSPLPDSYWRATYDLERAVRRLVRIHEDDRFLSPRLSWGAGLVLIVGGAVGWDLGYGSCPAGWCR